MPATIAETVAATVALIE